VIADLALVAMALILLEKVADGDFKMVYYNADGSESTMCGNGGRCITQFAYDLGMHQLNYRFLAIDGWHNSSIEDHVIRLQMIDVDQVLDLGDAHVLNTGSPHYVKFVNDLKHHAVQQEGAAIRYNEVYKQQGINVNFVETNNEDTISVRTYERGVEAETFSCGTGVTAAAIVCAHNERGFNRIEVRTLGGHLAVEYDKINDHHFQNIWLCGPAKFVFEGKLKI
jgi:diaminopimelate epimerase